MPLDVIMPALGMAQETGQIVAWHKKAGDPVASGDVLFEVETDKATMEVEAQGDGFLTDVTADEGTDVPVGTVIARISDSADATAPAPSPDSLSDAAPDTVDDVPAGKEVIMPTLGMAQDTGLLVAWHKAAGDAVGAEDVLFEVETDKSTMEVPAGFDGFLAAILAGDGEDVPVGQVIAIISAEAPAHPITRKASVAPASSAPEKPQAKPAPKPTKAAKALPAKPSPTPASGDRILASPKTRRLALEQGLDLSRLVAAGHPQPFHVADLDMLKALPDDMAGKGSTPAQAAGRITAELVTEGFNEFAEWAAETANLSDAAALLAGLCAASLGRDTTIAVERFGQTTAYAASNRLGTTDTSEDAPEIRIRDLRSTLVSTVQVGAEDVPTFTVVSAGAGLALTLEYNAGQMTAPEAITLLSNFAGRLEQPLRHLL